MVATIDLKMTPTRLNFTPPDVLPEAPPTAMISAMARKAPEENTTVS